MGALDTRFGRPGSVTAIGVISIVIAALSLLMNVGLTFQAMIAYSSSRMIAAATASPPVSTSSTTLAVGDEFLSPSGLPRQQRALFDEVLGSQQRFNPERQSQLESFLTDHGRALLADDALPTTVDEVRRLINTSGRLPGLGGEEGRLFFELSTGRLEVGNDSAVFFPADGSPTLRSGGTLAGPDGSRVLSPAQVQAAIDHVQQLSGNGLSATEVAALDNALRKPWQPILQPAGTVAGIRSQITSATRAPNGQMILQTSRGTVTIRPQGVVEINGMVVATATGGAVMAMNRAPVSSAIAAALVSALLAVGLMILGIQVLRQWRPAGKWLKAWALAKLAIAIASAAAWVWFYQDLVSAFTTGRRVLTVTTAGVIGLTGAACLWPIILLIVLHTRRLRCYFGSPA